MQILVFVHIFASRFHLLARDGIFVKYFTPYFIIYNPLPEHGKYIFINSVFPSSSNCHMLITVTETKFTNKINTEKRLTYFKIINADNRKLFYFDALRVAMSVTNTASRRKKCQKRKIKTNG